MRCVLPFLLVPALGLAAACGPQGAPSPGADVDAAMIAQDPVIARALHDPLMTDPDLASRNEANAAIGFPDSAALPMLAAGPDEVSAAREAMRLELLATGAIPPLPPPGEATAKPLGPRSSGAELLGAVSAPGPCAKALKEDFARAADLPAPAAIPPRAMVVQAGGADSAGCKVVIVRYLSPVPREEVLQYHHTRALRAGLKPVRQGDAITARGKGAEQLAVHVRDAPGGLAGVTLVYRAN
jgi:hypothetical protein